MKLKVRKIPWVTLVSLFLLSGCATTAKYQENLDSWIGQDFIKLVYAWGYPPEVTELPNGNKEYAYKREKTFYVQRTAGKESYTNKNFDKPIVVGTDEYRSWCKTFFKVDSNNKILYWRYEGNDCTSK